MDILLDDRPTSATGVQVAVIYNSWVRAGGHEEGAVTEESAPPPALTVRLIRRGEGSLSDGDGGDDSATMDYGTYESRGDGRASCHENCRHRTVLLFLCKGLIPLSQMAAEVKKVVVLDCRWQRPKWGTHKRGGENRRNRSGLFRLGHDHKLANPYRAPGTRLVVHLPELRPPRGDQRPPVRARCPCWVLRSCVRRLAAFAALNAGSWTSKYITKCVNV